MKIKNVLIACFVLILLGCAKNGKVDRVLTQEEQGQLSPDDVIELFKE
jgi:hypothetical protein